MFTKTTKERLYPLMSTHIHTYIHTYIHPSIHPSIHTCMHACMHACIHTYIHTYCEQASSGLPPRNHTPAAVFSARWFHVWLQMLSPNVPSQALWLEPKQRTRINCTMQIYKNMQLSKLRGCQTYLPNYAVAVQRKLHLHSPLSRSCLGPNTWPISYLRMFHIHLIYKRLRSMYKTLAMYK